jgi:hypothetical protein
MLPGVIALFAYASFQCDFSPPPMMFLSSDISLILGAAFKYFPLDETSDLGGGPLCFEDAIAGHYCRWLGSPHL